MTSPDGVKRPLDELAEIDIKRGYSEINRLSQRRSITVVADIDVAKSSLTSGQITGDMDKRLMPDLLTEYPLVSIRWEGEQEQTQESLESLAVGFIVALFAMFVLLTMEFKSYFQPLLIIAIIPFGCAGSVFGHALLGMPLTIFSMFGLVALAGVVVNDSIVLIDFINYRVRSGMPLYDSLREAGQLRFRPCFSHKRDDDRGTFSADDRDEFSGSVFSSNGYVTCFWLGSDNTHCSYSGAGHVLLFWNIGSKANR